ncbi:LOW QUALITY PROTEIN: H-2 class I histocompatibility antigen, Q10 alpha chain-like [Apodemus sylvaticus]|uniref:LOW QUALITY PROTEIN: H-2 class I histocompatibility antigen, Q10 alpha chain-like n=1 Tax=Apodemus sylvaticus TaxID=10129 RepID=UPI0022449C40|nr:LOW QUALITY PROTEIN: H-2 class I histocompatibility antigen, Q10 alpha chain-like [Apodemus sylvaticus]
MKTFVTEALLLLLKALLSLTSYQEGTIFLGFFQTLFTVRGLPNPQFISVGFVDDIQFERFNSRRDVQRTEHCAPWIDQKKPEDWKDSTDQVLSYFQDFTEVLQRMLKIYNYSSTGCHILQRRYSCYVLLQRYFNHAFFELAINDHDYIRLNKDRRTWTLVGKFVEMLKEECNTSGFTESVKNYLEYKCMEALLTELEYGKEILLKTDTPKTHVTYKVRSQKKITLRCWALNFYPAEITLIWEKDESSQTAHMEVSEPRPSGDGIFQKRAALVVQSGEEQRYTCHVNHEGLPEPMTLRWGKDWKAGDHHLFLATVIAVILGALFMGSMMTFLIWKRKTRVGELGFALITKSNWYFLRCNM